MNQQPPKTFARMLAQEIKKQFLNTPMGNKPFTKENGQETIGALQ